MPDASPPLSYREAYARLARIAAELETGEADLDRVLPLLEEARAAYAACRERIEAVRAVLDHAFRVQGLHKVSAECDARNTASARLLERTGFTREGLLRRHTWIKGEWTDDLLYGLLEVDFFGVTPPAP